MYRPYQPDHANAESGPSRLDAGSADRPTSSDPQPKLKKRRRLQFTSQIRNTVQRYNPDGTETVEYLHQQSTQRLKRKWDSIFDRFKDAHLQEQDEIYLGNRANGEPIVVVKDRGSLRSLRQDMEFGVFIKDEELQGWKERPEAREMQDDEDEYEEDFDPSHMPLHQRQLAGASSSESEDEEEDPAANDPDLREFLQAEAQRKAMLGQGGTGDQGAEEEDEEIIDFGDPAWADTETSRNVFIPSTQTATKVARTSKPTSAPSRLSMPQPELAQSSSEDDDDTDVVTVHSDSDEELIESIRTKRQNIEELLQCTTPFETLPYNDIFGLADLLKISDNTSRLYVDLVSDDEDELIPMAPQTKDEKPAVKAIAGEEVIDIASSLPNTVIDLVSSLPNSSSVVEIMSSPVPSPAVSRASSLEPAAPGSERSMTPDEDSSGIALVGPLGQTPNGAVAMLPPSSNHSLQSTQPSQPEPAVAVKLSPLPVAVTRSSSPPIAAVALPTQAPAVEDVGLPELAPPAMTPPAATPPAATPVVAAPVAAATAAMEEEEEELEEQEAPVLVPAVRTPSPPQPSVIASPASRQSSLTPAAPPQPRQESQPRPATPPRAPSPELHKPLSVARPSAATVASSSTSVPTSVSAPSLSSRPDRESPHRRHSHKSSESRRSSHSKRHSLGADDVSTKAKKKKRSKCGGPDKCKKTFCLNCASLSR